MDSEGRESDEMEEEQEGYDENYQSVIEVEKRKSEGIKKKIEEDWITMMNIDIEILLW